MPPSIPHGSPPPSPDENDGFTRNEIQSLYDYLKSTSAIPLHAPFSPTADERFDLKAILEERGVSPTSLSCTRRGKKKRGDDDEMVDLIPMDEVRFTIDRAQRVLLLLLKKDGFDNGPFPAIPFNEKSVMALITLLQSSLRELSQLPLV